MNFLIIMAVCIVGTWAGMALTLWKTNILKEKE